MTTFKKSQVNRILYINACNYSALPNLIIYLGFTSTNLIDSVPIRRWWFPKNVRVHGASMDQTRWFNYDKHFWLIYCEGKVIMYNTKIHTRELASISSINIMILLNVELLPERLKSICQLLIGKRLRHYHRPLNHI